ncbi:MAG: 1-acyl-sn-glycerol-3-phosphate acyltransferase, partial [Deltaproteobacteria bacterium]|nr:1-acyl-sn-glycerol-3-phosphate acyltransferase [Deltaproteobacteria bacterium]
MISSMNKTPGFFTKFIFFFLAPYIQWLKRKRPEILQNTLAEAGNLDFSGMLPRFNFLHRLFFRKTLSRIQMSPEDLEKIRSAQTKGPVVFMMRHWGQIEYNFFNVLFLKENLPLAAHANLIRMHWWMPFQLWLAKWVARFDFFEKHQSLENYECDASLSERIRKQEPLFLFLNLPRILGQDDLENDALFSPLLKGVKELDTHQTLTLIPLTLIYDRRPSKERSSFIDLFFGEKENPGSLRKTILFFRHFKKHAVAQVGSPLDLKQFLAEKNMNEPEQRIALCHKLHEIFFKEQKAITGPRLRSRKSMIDLVMQDEKLKESMRALALETQKPLDTLFLEAEKILEEMVSDPNYHYIDMWDKVLSWAFQHVYEGLIIDEAGLNRLRQVARNYPIVLVPSHRSHVDYLLLSYIFYEHNLSMPIIAAGANLSFWPMGHLFRKSGAYFIRRTFGNDRLYPLLFKAYVKTLLHEGYYQEFFIEGTRSRTGKLEKPKTGMLSMFLECFEEGSAEDIYFIPIAINYEKVFEEGSYAEEVKGGHKKS